MLSLLLSGNFDLPSVVAEILAVLLIIFLILPFHEWAHAFTASLLGDRAMRGRGRLTFNPLNHIDPFGALCMLLFGFGWAKAVPVDPRSFKHPKLGMAITALMGPVANLVAALAGMLVYNTIYTFAVSFYTTTLGVFLEIFLLFYIQCNIGLAIFNLIPIPPLDGSKILFLFLPDEAVDFCYRNSSIFFVILFAFLFTGWLGSLLGWVTNIVEQGLFWISSLPFSFFINGSY